MQVAARFTALIRPDDLVARLSGDEFVAFIGALGGPSEAAIAAQLLSALDRPFELRGQAVSVSASLGISLYPTDAQHAQALQRCADEAIYRVKRSEKVRCGSLRLRDHSVASGVCLWCLDVGSQAQGAKVEGRCRRRRSSISCCRSAGPCRSDAC
ncbi:diguanylate cyclase domain-containing protein [Deinococcus sp. KNUC1210]|uniref:diguanylate cyclase domain-containing protein n=1 Tax=Deinococcus sp. KNUC1210 TaxID=2917691 RepID=UPI00351D556A